jgi:DNA polymerase
MIFFDFEVFKYDWLVVLIDPQKDDPYVVINDRDKLIRIYEQYKNDIWIGYNSRHYDQYILKAILCDLDPWECNKHIIIDNRPGWAFSSLFNKIFLINYDVMPAKDKSLKELEGFQGHNIHESDVVFTIDRRLTDTEIAETVEYCTNDVIETMNVFAANISDYHAISWLVHEFGFPLSYMSKTKAQISAEILECEKKPHTDEWDIYPLDCLQLSEYWNVEAWFMNDSNHFYKYPDGKKNNYKCDVAGVPHSFGWGGAHGARAKYHYRCDKDHLMLHVDVASYYPRLMIFHDLLTRNARAPERFRQIYERRIQLKHEGKKKEQAPLKIVINGTFGISKDVNNKAYDPRNANLICVNGQLLLLDLIEHLESVKSFELIQSNTDGLIIKIRRSDFDQVDDICYEWEERCNMELEFDYIREIYQKDVNNYLFIGYKGEVERRGKYVKDLSPMDNDLPIINKALVDYMVKGIPVRQTINNCNDLIQFQKICKLTNKFTHVVHDGKTYTNKCYRIFASAALDHGTVYKVKEGDRYFKFGDTPDSAFIENGDITGRAVPIHLDKDWYIHLAEKRLEQYGC